MFDLEVEGIKYTLKNEYGDFYWMNNQVEYSDSLFIFNDNEEYHNTNRSGAGNAIMRMYNLHSKHNPPKSAGIPTGTLNDGGYQKFTPTVKKTIDDAFDEIIDLINKYKYNRVYFSSELDGKLGTSIFKVNQKVLTYITNRIYNLSIHPVKITKILPNDKFNINIDFDIDSDNKNKYVDEDGDVDVDV
jgi:hypothetical protein